MSQMQKELSEHVTNGDEAAYAQKLGNFSKGLPHNELGEVNPDAYGAFVHACATGAPADFEAIPMGCPAANRLKLTNPQSGLAFDLEGMDSHATFIPPAPSFSSAEQACEILENYWMALARDIPFSEYDTHPLTHAAAQDLSRISDFRGPKIGNRVTTGTLFRGLTPGDLTGPYISQFFLLAAPYGANYIEQRIRTAVPNEDFMTDFSEWLSVQRGFPPAAQNHFDAERRYIRKGRDIASWVHLDVLYQAYFHAMLILLQPPSSDPLRSGIGAPFDAGNPYTSSATQMGFGSFGGPHIAALMPEAATRALHAVWFQKWFVHRRLRPEVHAGRIHNFLTHAAPHYPLGRSDLLQSSVLDRLYSKSGTYLLPMAFPEGSPAHPSYGAGHATVAGASVTLLKAWFDESYIIPNAVQPAPDGLSLEPYTGAPLTVGGELNKLASNVALGRNIAGVHWRSDATESLKLGELIAINILKDQKSTYNEDFGGFTLTKFDGTTITV